MAVPRRLWNHRAYERATACTLRASQASYFRQVWQRYVLMMKKIKIGTTLTQDPSLTPNMYEFRKHFELKPGHGSYPIAPLPRIPSPPSSSRFGTWLAVCPVPMVRVACDIIPPFLQHFRAPPYHLPCPSAFLIPHASTCICWCPWPAFFFTRPPSFFYPTPPPRLLPMVTLQPQPIGSVFECRL